jgi:hypothetical protein
MTRQTKTENDSAILKRLEISSRPVILDLSLARETLFSTGLVLNKYSREKSLLKRPYEQNCLTTKYHLAGLTDKSLALTYK